MWNRTPGFLYNHCKIKLNSGVNIFTFSTSALHFLSFMMNYVVWLTLFPNLKVLVLAEILDLPCPNIFNKEPLIHVCMASSAEGLARLGEGRSKAHVLSEWSRTVQTQIIARLWIWIAHTQMGIWSQWNYCWAMGSSCWVLLSQVRTHTVKQ